jgi:ribosomal protein S18 acetylase RimI-like enzyme
VAWSRYSQPLSRNASRIEAMFSTSSITLLPFSESIVDRSNLYALYCLSLREYIEPVFGWNEEFQRQRFEREYPSHQTFLVVHRSMIAGFIVLKHENTEIHLSLIILYPNYQSLGIGARVIELVLAQAKSLHVPLTLSCFRRNDQALKFYNRNGFHTAYEDDHFSFLTILP